MLSLSCLFLLIPVLASAGAKLEVLNGTRNIGEVKEGIKVPVTFTMINRGDKTATGIQIRTPGGCVAAGSLAIDKLGPGKSVQLKFFYETLGYGGRTSSRRVLIFFDGQRRDPLVLTVTGKVLPTKPYEAPAGELKINFFLLLDVRSVESFAKKHIAGSINIPEKKLEKFVSVLPKDLVIYLCSEKGEKSAEAAKKLRKKGFSECVSLIGGIKEWEKQYGKKLLIRGSR